MGPAARPAFANLLRNLGSGELRIGGSSQDLMPFEPAAPNTNRNITPADLQAVRATLDAVNARDRRREDPSWGTILGTALAPVEPERPWVGARARPRVRAAGRRAGVRGRRRALRRGHRPRQRARHPLRLRPAALPRRPRRLPRRERDAPVRDRRAEHERDDRAVAVDRRAHDPDALLLGLARDPRHDRARDEGRAHGPRHARDRPLLSAGARLHDRRVPLRVDRAAAVRRALGEPRLRGLHARGHGARARPRLPPPGDRHRGGPRASTASRTSPPPRPGRSRRCSSRRARSRRTRQARTPTARPGSVGINLHNAEVNRFFVPEEGNAFYNADRLRPVAGRGCAGGGAAVLRPAAVLALRAGHPRPASGRARARGGPGRADPGVGGRRGPRRPAGAPRQPRAPAR